MQVHSKEGAVRAAARHESKANASYAEFLDGLCQRLGAERESAARIAAAVLCMLEQRIQLDEAAQLEAQLPTKIRDLLFHCSMHVSEPPRAIDRARFVSVVAAELGVSGADAEAYVREVFRAVARQVSAGEAEQVRTQLPADLGALWPASEQR